MRICVCDDHHLKQNVFFSLCVFCFTCKRWEGIQAIRVRDGSLGLSHFKLLKRLGCGDIGSVYLAELRGSHSHFAMKVRYLPPVLY